MKSEFIIEPIGTKSINCDSCGAGLNNPTQDRCTCTYCGNTNIILKGGRTKIVEVKPVPVGFKKETKPFKLTAGHVLLFLFIGFFGLFLMGHIKKYYAK